MRRGYIGFSSKLSTRLAGSLRILTPLRGIAPLILLLLIASCGGSSLSDEQRKKLRQGIDDTKIAQVSDAEIVTAGMDEGRRVFETLEKSNFDASAQKQIAHDKKVKVRYITPGKGDALEVENQIIQAYIVGSVTGATQDNIQKLRSGAATSLQDYDTLLYSHPIVTSMPDGSVNVNGVWNIYLAKREIVRGLSKK
ncbi:hypothetical protein WBG78_02445 [Chryseolinea sp. T2]|uniref:hypothetical protein n=1 Tax=Chryseolinea sp. T2 TaxID=3129255 RepID=UPI00307805D9